MFNLTYLPREDIERQKHLQDELKEARGRPRADTIIRELAELEKKRKPIIECNIEETIELKAYLYDKLEMVLKIGKRQQADQFRHMIKILEDRIMVLNLEMRREEKENIERILKDKEERKSEAEEIKRERIERGEDPPERRSGSSRWTTGFDKID